jgi:hypothetical protein
MGEEHQTGGIGRQVELAAEGDSLDRNDKRFPRHEIHKLISNPLKGAISTNQKPSRHLS